MEINCRLVKFFGTMGFCAISFADFNQAQGKAQESKHAYDWGEIRVVRCTIALEQLF